MDINIANNTANRYAIIATNSTKDAIFSKQTVIDQSPSKDLTKKIDNNVIEKVEDDFDNNNVVFKREMLEGRSIFTLFKLNDGVLYTRIRNLDTGEIKYFPTLDDAEFFEIIDKSNGNILDLKS
jgi:hypothetical protein